MSTVVFKALRRSRVVADFECSFRQTTGMWVRLAPSDVTIEPRRGQCAENPFCSLIMTVPGVRAVCQRTETGLQRSVQELRVLRQCQCFAGLSVAAVPVPARGDHVATLLAGQVLRRRPTTRDLARLGKQLAAWGVNGQWPIATKALANTPVVSAQKLSAAIELLTVFAQLLGEYAGRNLLACCPGEAPAIAPAKELIESRLEDRLAMSVVAREVGLSPTHFCKTFHEATGMTFTECVARARMDKAKTLLANPFVRVSEVAFACGFRAIPHFNEVFKKQTVLTPTEFRRRLGRQNS